MVVRRDLLEDDRPGVVGPPGRGRRWVTRSPLNTQQRTVYKSESPIRCVQFAHSVIHCVVVWLTRPRAVAKVRVLFGLVCGRIRFGGGGGRATTRDGSDKARAHNERAAQQTRIETRRREGVDRT